MFRNFAKNVVNTVTVEGVVVDNEIRFYTPNTAHGIQKMLKKARPGLESLIMDDLHTNGREKHETVRYDIAIHENCVAHGLIPVSVNYVVTRKTD